MSGLPHYEEVHIESVAHPNRIYVLDVQWLLSSWQCGFGVKCEGAHGNPVHGCCTIGAQLSQDADARPAEEQRIQAMIDLVAKEGTGEIDNLDLIQKRGWFSSRVGGNTRTHKGVCIFANSADNPHGPGCSLHIAAVNRGLNYRDHKPLVCSNAPLFWDWESSIYDEDGNVATEVCNVRRMENSDWREDGEFLDWWCIEHEEFYDADSCVFMRYREEMERYMGEDDYKLIADYLKAELTRRKQRGQDVSVPVYVRIEAHK